MKLEALLNFIAPAQRAADMICQSFLELSSMLEESSPMRVHLFSLGVLLNLGSIVYCLGTWNHQQKPSLVPLGLVLAGGVMMLETLC